MRAHAPVKTRARVAEIDDRLAVGARVAGRTLTQVLKWRDAYAEAAVVAGLAQTGLVLPLAVEAVVAGRARARVHVGEGRGAAAALTRVRLTLVHVNVTDKARVAGTALTAPQVRSRLDTDTIFAGARQTHVDLGLAPVAGVAGRTHARVKVLTSVGV